MKKKRSINRRPDTHPILSGPRAPTWAQLLSKWAWLVVVFLILCLYQHVNGEMWINSDASSELILACQLNKEGAILTPNWYYSTELRVLYTQLVFAPLFSVFSDWHMIRLVGTIILYAILLLSYFYFCTQAELLRIYPWTAPVLLLPVSAVYTEIVLTGVYYIPHVAIMFGMLGFVFHILNSKTKWKRYLLLGAASGISLLAGMGGMREVLIFYIPLSLCAFVLWCVNTLIPDGSSRQKDRYAWQTYFLVTAAVITFFSGIGCLYNLKILSQEYSFYQHSSINFRQFSINMLATLISAYLEILGYRGGSIFSINLLYNAACGVMILTVIAAFVYLHRKHVKLNRNEQIIVMLSVCIFVVFNTFYLMTDMYFTSRYVIPSIVSALPVVGIFFLKLPWRDLGRKAVIVLLGIFITISSFTFLHYFAGGNVKALKPIAEQLVSEGYQYGYATFWNGDVLTELTDGQLDMYVLRGDSTGIDQLYEWLQLKDHFETPPQGKLFAIFFNSELESWPLAQTLARGRLFYQDDSYTVCTYSSYEILSKFQDAAGLPAEDQKEKTDYPFNSGFSFRNAALSEDNELVSNGSAGYVLYGPFSNSIPGIYDITLHYTVESYAESDSGAFDVALDTVQYREIPFTAEGNTAVLEQVEIEGEHQFEVRVYVPEGMIIRIQSIDYRRIGS